MRIICYITAIIFLGFIQLKADDGDVNIIMEELLVEYKNAKTPIDKAKILRRLVKESAYSDDNSANYFLKEFEELSIKTGDPAIYARLYNTKAALTYMHDLHADSIHYWLNKATEVIRINNLKDVEIQIAIINNRAITYTSVAKYNLAIKEYSKGLEILLQQKDRLYHLETIFYCNIGFMMLNANKNEQALEYIRKAEIADKLQHEKTGLVSERFEYLPSTKADILYNLKRFDEAEDILESILALDNKPNYTNNFCKILLGDIYIQNNKTELGYSYLNDGFEEAKKLEANLDNQVYASLNLAKFELSKNNIDAAMGHANYIMSLQEENDRELFYSEVHQVIGKILEEKGRYKESLEHNKSYQKLKEEELALENDITFAEFQQKLSDKEKLYQIKELEIKERLQESIISILIIGFIFSIISLAIIYYLYSRKEEHNKNLIQKNAEITVAKDNALKAAKAKENFLSTMSHEMRTPMNAIIGITNILLDENECEYQKQHLTNLKFSGEGLLHVINEVLDFSKIEAAKLKIIKNEFNLQENLNSIINSLRHGNNNKKVKIIQDQRLTDLKCLVFGDKERINQVLTNLLGNAIKFTSEGLIVLRTMATNNTDTTVQIHFQVEDTGIGIPADKLQSIFDSFSQVNNEINRVHQGTGLGLGISKRLVELQGGQLSVKSIEGKGSIFSFILEFEKRVLKPDTPTKRVSHTIYKEGLEGKKILLVEDNKLNQLVALNVLKKFKVEAELAENGQEAVEMVSSNYYDIILMDIHMPIMDGIEATEKIRALKDPKVRTIPIIALTADAYSDKVIAATKSGMNDYLSKPFKPSELFEMIQENITANKNRPATQ